MAYKCLSAKDSVYFCLLRESHTRDEWQTRVAAYMGEGLQERRPFEAFHDSHKVVVIVKGCGLLRIRIG